MIIKFDSKYRKKIRGFNHINMWDKLIKKITEECTINVSVGVYRPINNFVEDNISWSTKLKIRFRLYEDGRL